MVKLSERLSAVSKLITPTLKVADVGCDHGYLSIYLLQNNITDKVIASDVRKGPLSKASENVKLYGLNDKIELRLSDGLTNYKTGEVESVVMSGMGGNLMIKILEESKEIVESVKELILQPQSEIAGLAMQAAKKIVDEKTENQGNKGIYDQFLEGVGEAHGNTDID